ncbi:MAG: DAK2 domain-containing protein [Clostridia bacterium]|nr:DAK2 domain-containing protein [Clostridia bacterium]
MFKPKKKAEITENKKEPYNLKYLGGWLMAKMAFGGAARLRSNTEEVNRLNVFPVPDGDTGDNMRMTIESGIAAIEDLDSDDLAEVMKVFSHGMLLGARGNSGVILSQFFSGTAKGFEGTDKADPSTLGRALEMGVKQAYNSVMTPTEGTILTVAREAVEYAVSSITPQSTIRSFFSDLAKEMHESLKRTPESLAVLKEAGVVDSGGAGLLYIIEGFNNVLNGEEVSRESLQIQAPAKAVSVRMDFDSESRMEYGYCTELMIQLMKYKTDVDAFSVGPLREYLAGIGNSIVAFKTDSLVKVHVHTFEPEKVLEYCRQFGEFVSVKIENMSIQHTGLADHDHDHDDEEAEPKQYGVVSVSNGSGIESLFRELGADEIVEGGQTRNPSTNDFLDAFRKINAKTIFVFPNNSNILMAASQAAELYDRSSVIVIPSKSIGTGYAALSVADFSDPDPEAIKKGMIDAMSSVVSAYLSPTVRDALINGINIKKGDIIGVIEKSIVLASPDCREAAGSLAEKLVKDNGKTMLTVFIGKDTDDDEVSDVKNEIEEKCPGCEIYYIDGGQEVYPYLFLAE